jgi:lipopolysaccharide assembly outer membrane protein LptD (OstA)
MARPTITLVLCLLTLPLAVFAQQQPTWEMEGLLEGSLVEYTPEFSRGSGGVRISYSGAVLTAEKVELDNQSGEVLAEGKVFIQRNEQIWVGERIRYNFKNKSIEAEQFRTGKYPVFAAGHGLHADITNNVYAATNAYITSDDIAEPAIKVRAKYIKIIPGEKIIARSATLYVGEVPVFYFPYYTRNLGPHANNFDFIPGYRTKFGPFLLGSYTWYLNEQLDGELHVDYRERRGIGTGPDVNYHLGPWGKGTFRYYYLHDQEPDAGDIPGFIPPDDRQRVYFSYQSEPATNLEVKALVRYESDASIVREFFEREYRQNPQPNSFFDFHKFWQNFSLEAYAQPRVNDFYETVERLPDIRLTGFRQQLGPTPVYYESESSAGYYHRRFAETNGPVPGDFAAARADTFHQLLLPQTFFGWLNVTPRVGGRFTYYSRATGEGATTDEVYRGVFNTGAELSFKLSQTWPAFQNRFFEMDGLRHIIEPSFNYVFVPSPTHPTNELPAFDYELPSLRLLPINFPDYNAIDSIDSQNVVRLGLRNKVQTKRQGAVEDFLRWDLYTDWRLQTDRGQTTFADVYSDLTVKPRSWLKLESLTRFDVYTGNFRLAFDTLTIQPNNQWNWMLGNFYLRDDSAQPTTGLGQGNNLFVSSFFYRVNENWGLRATHHFEARDGRLEEQAYSIYRDLRSWTAALTLRLRDNRVGSDDVTVAFTFSFKAHPRYGVGSDAVRPYYLLGS